MGDVADMMTEGTLCVGCGVALKGEGYGIPRACSNQCARDQKAVGIQSDGALIYDKKFADKLGSKIVSDKVDLSA